MKRTRSRSERDLINLEYKVQNWAIHFIYVFHFSEILETDAKLWHQIRGTLMIILMKLSSLGFDLDAGKILRNNQSTIPSTPNLIQVMGYVMCPANCVLGPWCSYTDYIAIYKESIFTKWVIFYLKLLHKVK